ncbi:hypothetical protein HK097_010956 [Rhizophlyctis rosea]|uniref:Uncharacterized protein n=1 Tax=Rhizophlyctis rosea TaxID=64517 RepID=A0AAD5SIH1_9FUNG|nr:hypothetical protein HK097_010956 [Rhizophlyctis rosea]
MSLHVHVDLPFLRPIWDGLDKEKEDEDIADDEVQRERLREVRRMFQEVEGRWLERRNGGLKLVELDMDV